MMDWLPLCDPWRLPSNDDRQLDLAQSYHRERASLDAEVELAAMFEGGGMTAEDRAALRWQIRDDAERLFAAALQTETQ